MNSRRKFLTGTATTGAAALALTAFPPSIRRALAIPANNKTGTINDVEHIVILMQENRSFDHYFGTLPGVRGFGDRFTIPLPGGRNVWQQADDAGRLVMPYHLDQSKGNAQRVSGTPHTWNDSQDAWDGGRISQWPRYKTDAAMGYFMEAELPFQFSLANAFTLCDSYHCAMHTGTDANRSFHLTGTNGATAQGVAYVNNEWDWLDGTAAAVNTGYTWKTYAERLEDAGVRWICYQNMPDEWGDNMLGAFRQFRAANRASPFPVSSGNMNKPYSNSGQAVPYHAYDAASDNPGNPLYKGIANTLPGSKPEEYLDAFRKDIREGRLPQVSWINAPSIYCEHPDPSSPVQGAWFLQEILDALTAVPEVWSKTVLLVNFDENDGYFDHVPSPSAPSLGADGKPAGKTTLADADLAHEYFTQPPPAGSSKQPKPDGRVFGPGPRVPMYVISPWSRGGWVNSQVFDHTSVLRFIEARFGVKETNISPFRRAVAGDLTSAFNFATPNGEALPSLAGRQNRGQADQLRKDQEALTAVPLPLDPQLPRQGTGTRPSRALPYELHTSARADAVGRTVQLLFSNTGKAAAVFHVYDRLHLELKPRRYMVEAGKGLDDTWTPAAGDNGLYDLWVLGPNGFHRHFKGNLDTLRAGDAARPEVRVCYDIANGNVYLSMRNDGKAACKFTISAQAYRTDGPWTASVSGGASVDQHWVLADSGQWYDFAVTCDADPAYYRRFAGRVETGRHTVSDPAMGLPAP
ncbi:phospholipase C, phosphocholine-specific [Variovorax sp. J22G73]|uniref:phosphocholine-specific phospholipase C n=1 Tax=unclassified Variovorax TaxID=663243 RepID=UPI0025779450|nr:MULTISPECIES: phospholipase C, phosphocholine-specific [unclassified Variovorax]MDM0004597.1 phospholipase C, phosphocholine-specific [Variovorax sp. J22R203]MDM0095737.1 phospholipase C, phosphocholine-specific [Variovorax sp. J22G73]